MNEFFFKFNLFLYFFPEPKSGFKIAFNMFDTDGNQRVDKNEFLVVSITKKMKFFFSSNYPSISSKFLQKLRFGTLEQFEF